MTLKDFYYKLQNILTDYYDTELDIDDASMQIEALKIEAVSNGLEVSISSTILETITPNSSYDDDSSYDDEDEDEDEDSTTSY